MLTFSDFIKQLDNLRNAKDSHDLSRANNGKLNINNCSNYNPKFNDFNNINSNFCPKTNKMIADEDNDSDDEINLNEIPGYNKKEDKSLFESKKKRTRRSNKNKDKSSKDTKDEKKDSSGKNEVSGRKEIIKMKMKEKFPVFSKEFDKCDFYKRMKNKIQKFGPFDCRKDNFIKISHNELTYAKVELQFNTTPIDSDILDFFTHYTMEYIYVQDLENRRVILAGKIMNLDDFLVKISGKEGFITKFSVREFSFEIHKNKNDLYGQFHSNTENLKTNIGNKELSDYRKEYSNLQSQREYFKKLDHVKKFNKI